VTRALWQVDEPRLVTRQAIVPTAQRGDALQLKHGLPAACASLNSADSWGSGTTQLDLAPPAPSCVEGAEHDMFHPMWAEVPWLLDGR
jgi:hypothetical protein